MPTTATGKETAILSISASVSPISTVLTAVSASVRLAKLSWTHRWVTSMVLLIDCLAAALPVVLVS